MDSELLREDKEGQIQKFLEGQRKEIEQFLEGHRNEIEQLCQGKDDQMQQLLQDFRRKDSEEYSKLKKDVANVQDTASVLRLMYVYSPDLLSISFQRLIRSFLRQGAEVDRPLHKLEDY